MSREFLTPEEDELLINHVSKHPCVYDFSCDDYRNPSVKDRSWQQISVVVGRSVEECKYRWRNIRDTYNKRKQRNGASKWRLATLLGFLNELPQKESVRMRTPKPRPSSTNEGNDKFESDSTYDIVIKEEVEEEVNSISDIKEADDNIQDLNMSRMFPSEPPVIENTSKPRCVHNVLGHSGFKDPLMNVATEPGVFINGLKTQEDHVDVFFKSIAMSVKALPKPLINEAKLRTLQMVMELECESSVNHDGVN